jgi:hypothetical protein
MKKKYLAPLALATLVSFPAAAGTITDSLIIGGFAGLTAGFISNAFANHSYHRHCRRSNCHRCQPTIVTERVYYKQPTTFVERPIIIEERPVIVERAPVVIEKASPIVTSPVVHDFRERELALKEQELKLELIKAENRKKELELKEKELIFKKA